MKLKKEDLDLLKLTVNPKKGGIILKACEAKQLQSVLQELMKKLEQIKNHDEMSYYMKLLIKEALKDTDKKLEVIYPNQYSRQKFLA